MASKSRTGVVALWSRRGWRRALCVCAFIVLTICAGVVSGFDVGSARAAGVAAKPHVLAAMPSAPTGVTATAQSPYTVLITWADHSGGTAQYEVSNGSESRYASAGATSWAWYGLQAGTYACFDVRAYDASGASSWSAYSCVTTPMANPTPTGVTATALSPYTVLITWVDHSGGTAQYEVGDGSESRYASAGATSWAWYGLQAGAYVCFHVRAYSDAGASDWSPYVCLTTPTVPPPAPSPPTGVGASPQSSYTVLVTWTDHSGGTAQYEISNGTESRYAGAGSTSWAWYGLQPGSYTCFHVRASNAGGSSAWSSYACTTTPAAPPPVPGIPASVHAVAINGTTVRISWAGSANTAQYVVSNGSASHGVAANLTSYNWGGLSPGAYTCFTVRAQNGSGSSAWSAYACVTIPVVPPVPGGVTAVVTSASTIHISWTGDRANQYVVDNGTVALGAPPGALSYDWGGLSPGTYMCFSVKGQNVSGGSPWSPYACVTIPVVPSLPTGITAVATSASTFHLSWTASSAATQYSISNGTKTQVIGAGSTSYNWGGLTPGTYMCVTVMAQNVSGGSGWSPYACATTAPASATPPRAPPWLQLFAPSATTFHLYWPDAAGGARYEISNGITSQLTAAGAISFDWGGLSPGTYMCFQIRAFTGSGGSSWTPSASPYYVCGTTPSTSSVPPSAPTSVTASAPYSYMIHLTWTNVGGTAQYQIDNGNTTLVTNVGATSFDWGAESPGTHVCFRIRAITASGASSWAPGAPSNWVCTTTPSASCQASADSPDSTGYVDLYHGTSLASATAITTNGIDPSRGHPYTDFGSGFYVTTSLAQAQAWANANFAGQSPSVIHYRMSYNELTPGSLCGLVFPLATPSAGYLAFVRAMRMVQQPIGCSGYDFVEGPLLTNPSAFLAGGAATTGGQQDTFCTSAGASILDAGFVAILPAS